ncbi:MAG: hypothetical protein ABR608_08575 [Pseudonocardiaceae bacterium]
MAGLVPVVGEAADGLNAAWYAAEGDTLNAGLSAAMIPFLGWGATGAKVGIKGAKGLKGADDVADTAKSAERGGDAAGPTRGAEPAAAPPPYPRDKSLLSPSDRRSVESYEKRIADHKDKLEAYRADPDKFDHKGILKNAPNEEVRQQIIDGRIKHLEKEIQAFQVTSIRFLRELDER